MTSVSTSFLSCDGGGLFVGGGLVVGGGRTRGEWEDGCTLEEEGSFGKDGGEVIVKMGNGVEEDGKWK